MTYGSRCTELTYAVRPRYWKITPILDITLIIAGDDDAVDDDADNDNDHDADKDDDDDSAEKVACVFQCLHELSCFRFISSVNSFSTSFQFVLALFTRTAYRIKGHLKKSELNWSIVYWLLLFKQCAYAVIEHLIFATVSKKKPALLYMV